MQNFSYGAASSHPPFGAPGDLLSGASSRLAEFGELDNSPPNGEAMRRRQRRLPPLVNGQRRLPPLVNQQPPLPPDVSGQPRLQWDVNQQPPPSLPEKPASDKPKSFTPCGPCWNEKRELLRRDYDTECEKELRASQLQIVADGDKVRPETDERYQNAVEATHRADAERYRRVDREFRGCRECNPNFDMDPEPPMGTNDNPGQPDDPASDTPMSFEPCDPCWYEMHLRGHKYISAHEKEFLASLYQYAEDGAKKRPEVVARYQNAVEACRLDKLDHWRRVEREFRGCKECNPNFDMDPEPPMGTNDNPEQDDFVIPIGERTVDLREVQNTNANPSPLLMAPTAPPMVQTDPLGQHGLYGIHNTTAQATPPLTAPTVPAMVQTDHLSHNNMHLLQGDRAAHNLPLYETEAPTSHPMVRTKASGRNKRRLPEENDYTNSLPFWGAMAHCAPGKSGANRCWQDQVPFGFVDGHSGASWSAFPANPQQELEQDGRDALPANPQEQQQTFTGGGPAPDTFRGSYPARNSPTGAGFPLWPSMYSSRR